MTISELTAEIERLQRECLEWQAALHHAETEARQCGFSGSIREPGPALLEILAERDALKAQCESLLGDAVKVADAEIERDEALAQAEAYKKLADIAIKTMKPLEESEHRFAALYQEARAQAARLAEALRAVQRDIFGDTKKTFYQISDSINAALASTDARKWLREEKVKECGSGSLTTSTTRTDSIQSSCSTLASASPNCGGRRGRDPQNHIQRHER